MTRDNILAELVYNGYELDSLQALNNDDLALLVQESFVENKWTEAARQARWKKHGIFVPEKRKALAESTKANRRIAAYHASIGQGPKTKAERKKARSLIRQLHKHQKAALKKTQFGKGIY